MPIPSHAETVDRLRALVLASGLSTSAFARVVLGRNPRTLHRWYAGDVIPSTVRNYIDALDRVQCDDWDRVCVVTKRKPHLYFRAGA